MSIRQSAPWAPNAKKTSGGFTGGPNKLLLHATITPAMALPAYSNQGTAPHVTLRWDGSRIIPNQHYFWDNFAKALANKPGGVETNRDSVRQVELAGYLNDRSGEFNILKAPDSYWVQVGQFLKPIAADLRLPNTAPADWTSSGRMSLNEWDNFSGLCAHVHVPENDHWDLPIPVRALSILRGTIFGTAKPQAPVKNPPVITPKSPQFPLYGSHYFGELSRDSRCHSGTYSATDRGYIRTWQRKMILRGWKGIGNVDGIFGDKCGDVAEQFQDEKGLSVDRKVGVQTWAATWTAPIS